MDVDRTIELGKQCHAIYALTTSPYLPEVSLQDLRSPESRLADLDDCCCKKFSVRTCIHVVSSDEITIK